jgi:glucan phosphoethanolaminetransferase (alkaline phosphatase superfamily)
MDGKFQEPSSKTGCKLPAIISITFLLMFVTITLLLILLVRNPQLTQLIRDLMIITLAIEALFIGIVVVLAIIQITKLIRLLQDDVKPILDQANETISTVRNIANIVNENLIGPILKIAGTLSGTVRFLKMIWPNRN